MGWDNVNALRWGQRPRCADWGVLADGVDGLADDAGAEGVEFFVDVLVAAVDLADVVDGAGALGAHGGDEEAHAGADVGGFEGCAVELAFADDDDAVWVAEDDFSAHGVEGVDEEHAAFEHFFEEQNAAVALGGDGDGDGHQVGGECGPDGVVDFGHGAGVVVADDHFLISGDEKVVFVADFGLDAEFGEYQADHAEIVGDNAFDGEFAAGDGGKAGEAADFEVVGADGVVAAPEAFGAFDGNGVGADAVDAGAHFGEHVAEALDVWFAGGVLDAGGAFGCGCGHEGVFGGGNRGFIHEDVVAFEVVAFEVIAGRGGVDFCAECFECEKVGVEAAAADDVTTGRWEFAFAHSAEHGAGEEDGCADFAAEFGVELDFVDVWRFYFDDVCFDPLVVAAEIGDDFEHDLDVCDTRDVAKSDFFIG